MAFCGNCGTQIEDGAAFCPNCGQKLESASQPVEQTQAAPMEQPVQETAPQQEQPVQQEQTQQWQAAPQQGQTQQWQAAPQQGQTQQYQAAPQQGQTQQWQAAPQQGQAQQWQAMPQGQPVKQKTPMSPKAKKGIIAGIIAAVVLIIAIVAVIMVVNYQKKKINVNDYISVEYTGCDTAGVANVYLDEYEFEKAVMKAQGKKAAKNLDDWDSLFSSSYDLYDLMDSIEFTVEPAEGLSNGDEITVTIDYDKQLAKKVGVRLIVKEQKFTVEGLGDVIEIDPFADVEVEFNGTAPDVWATYWNNSTDDYAMWLTFTFDKSDGLSVGDTVTLTVDDTEEEALAEGYRFTQTSKTYTVENADHYVMSLSEVSEETLASMQDEAFDIIDVYFTEYSEFLTHTEYVYAGTYMLTQKDQDGWDDYNRLYLVYKTTVTSLTNEFEPVEVFLPVGFTDIMEKQDGTQEYYDIGYFEGWTDVEFDDGWETLEGYNDGVLMYDELVGLEKDDYNYEVTEELQQFGN